MAGFEASDFAAAAAMSARDGPEFMAHASPTRRQKQSTWEDVAAVVVPRRRLPQKD